MIRVILMFIAFVREMFSTKDAAEAQEKGRFVYKLACWMNAIFIVYASLSALIGSGFDMSSPNEGGLIFVPIILFDIFAKFYGGFVGFITLLVAFVYARKQQQKRSLILFALGLLSFSSIGIDIIPPIRAMVLDPLLHLIFKGVFLGIGFVISLF